jgi:pilus assembly protein CpaD
LILSLTVAAALQACTSPPAQWSSAEAPRELRVDYLRLSHATGFTAGGVQFAKGEREGLDNFLAAAEVKPDDRVYLESAADDQVTISRMNELTRDLTRKGYSVSKLPAGHDAIAKNAVLVVVERYVVTPPDCPNWTQTPEGGHDNAVSSNFGCASMTNLSLMVADPRDLVIGRTLGPAEAAQAGLAVQRYRDGKVTPLPGITAGTTYNFNLGSSAGGGGGAATSQ